MGEVAAFCCAQATGGVLMFPKRRDCMRGLHDSAILGQKEGDTLFMALLVPTWSANMTQTTIYNPVT